MAIGDELAYQRLRASLGVDETVFPDETAEEYFEWANDTYPDNAAKREAYTRVLVIEGLLPGGMLLGKYTQNQSQEDFTKIKDNLAWWLDYWRQKVATVTDPVATPGGGLAFFTTAQGQRGR